jgi:predicted dinucleotide-binding enzyme
MQLLAPGGLVVKAFNAIFASRIADPVGDGVPLDGFYAGDEEAAQARVAELLAAMASARWMWLASPRLGCWS